MSFKYARGALRPSQNYVCFSCRLQNFRITNSQRPRNQHAEASQTVSNAEEDAIPSQNAKPEDRTGLKPKGEPSSRQAQPSDVGSKNNVCQSIQGSIVNAWCLLRTTTMGLRLMACRKILESGVYQMHKPVNWNKIYNDSSLSSAART